MPTEARSLSVRQLARRWAVSPRKVRAMIRRRLLRAFDVGLGGRRQLRIAPEDIVTAEQQRLAVQPAVPRRRKRTDDGISDSVRWRLGL